MHLRIIPIYILLFWSTLCIQGQEYDMHAGTDLSHLTQQGWQIQHQSLAYDSLFLYISAREPQQENNRLYVLALQGRTWGKPVPLFAADQSSSAQHLWPSISADGEHLYYVCRHQQVVNKRTIPTYQIYCAYRHEGVWEEGVPIIISSDKDISPLILPDNKTLLFSRRVSTKHKEGYYALFYTRSIDNYNWLIPQRIHNTDTRSLYGAYFIHEEDSTLYLTEQICQHKDTLYHNAAIALPPQFRGQPYDIVTGKLRDEHTGLPIKGNIYVYDAITAQLLFTAHTNPITGRFRLSLETSRTYLLDFTAEGYSHFYTDGGQNLDILLSKDLQIRIGLYDADELMPIQADQINIYEELTSTPVRVQKQIDSIGGVLVTLPIGKDYRLQFSKRGYKDKCVHLDAAKQVRFASSELDITMEPKMTRLSVRLIDIETGNNIEGTIQGKTYLRQGERCSLTCMAKGYFFTDTTFYTNTDTLQNITIALRPLRKDAVIQLRDIQFAYNSYFLSDDSYEELEKVRLLMEQNPSMLIELSAHTDDRGTDAYNDRLSARRGESVARYLIKSGIDASRIQSVGYGKRKPIVPNDSEENRTLNRRVEFKVLTND